jgi:methylated-DNA-[protein]-cysteine S-methyltransferase
MNETADLEQALAGFAKRAEEEGLVDVAWSTTDSPIGPLVLATTRRGLVRIGFGDAEAVLEDCAQRVSPRVLASPGRLDDVRRQLDEYFAGGRTKFELKLDWTLTAPFQRKILEATRRIPYGSVATYRDVAERAGNASASRAAGNALGGNPVPVVVPCHRVVRSGGGLGGYTGGLDIKRTLLRVEGALLV